MGFYAAGVMCNTGMGDQYLSAIGLVLHNRYEIIAEIGRGGMSTVYLAKDSTLGSYWAVKQVNNSINVDIEAFKKEVELLSTLSHSDIPRIVDRIEMNDDYFVVMDFVDGSSLGKKVIAEGPQPEDDIIEWAKMISDVLYYLHTVHENPIVYRDMKPDNVMLTHSGRIKLIDFGIAKECERGVQQTGANVGTKGYAAPEQYKGESNYLDERTDIYSLGATMFFLATGILPEKPPNAIRPVRQIDPLLSEGLEYIISKCTQDDPERRYQNCMELREDLNNVKQLTSAYRGQMMRKLLLFGGALALSLVCFILMLVGHLGIKAENEDNYNFAHQTAQGFLAQNNYSKAAEHYGKAIGYKPEEYDSYSKYFRVTLPHGEEVGSEDYAQKLKEAIEYMRGHYLENKNSKMYQNSRLMNEVAIECLKVNEPAYATYAVEYFKKVKDSKEYKNGDLNVNAVDHYMVIASNMAKTVGTQDFNSFGSALRSLEKNADEELLDPNEKLEQYYAIILVYSNYPAKLKGSYERIYEVGLKAKQTIDKAGDTDELTFDKQKVMYTTIASQQYNQGISLSDDQGDAKRTAFTRCLEWFAYLEDIHSELDEKMMLRKGQAYKGIADTYNTIDFRDSHRAEINSNFDQATAIYNECIRKNPDSFLGWVNLTQIQLDKEMMKPADSKNYSEVMASYRRVLEIKNTGKDLSTGAISRYTTLKQQMQSAGLEV